MSEIQNGSRVRINCPEARGIHGKVGTVKSDYHHFDCGRTVTVAVDHFGGQHSFLFLHELELIEDSALTKVIEERKQLRTKRNELQSELLRIETRLELMDKVIDLAVKLDLK